MAENLVLARVGSTSLHPCWIEPGKPRDWDLRLVPYQEIPSQAGLDCSVGDVIPGPKWSGLREALRQWDGWRDYEYVWMPDDDISASQDTISRMFEVARAAELDLFAPALHESSYYAHFITMRSQGFFGRWTGFVEIMIPGFSRAAMERLVPTLDLSETGWGWGLDSVWPKLLDYRNVGIIDATPVIHTRPVGRMRDVELARRVEAESDKLLATHQCRQTHVTFGAFDEGGAPVATPPEDLLSRLVEGYRYLWEKDPRILAWISEYQRPDGGWAEYPTAGTPG
jgi:hypothetical protein